MSNSPLEPGSSDSSVIGSKATKFSLKFRYRHKTLLKRHVWPFTWPIILELFCVVLMGIISTVLVARLGADKTAAVGFTDGITWIVISVMTAVALGGSVVVAQSFGRGDRESSLSAARTGHGSGHFCCHYLYVVHLHVFRFYALHRSLWS